MLYAFFWVIARFLNSDAGELPRRKHITFRTRRTFEIEKYYASSHIIVVYILYIYRENLHKTYVKQLNSKLH